MVKEMKKEKEERRKKKEERREKKNQYTRSKKLSWFISVGIVPLNELPFKYLFSKQKKKRKKRKQINY